MRKPIEYTLEVHPPSPYAELRDVTTRIVAESPMDLSAMVRRLQRCGHNHNFFVEQDVAVRDHFAIWVSKEGAFCATDGVIGESA